MYCNLQHLPDTTVICPYNSSHKILRSRLQRHIVKCEKNYPAEHLDICPFNASHRMPKEEMQNHLLTCESKIALNPSSYQTNTVCSNIFQRSRNLELRTTEDLIELWSDDDSGIESMPNNSSRVGEKIGNTKKEEDEDDYKPIRRPYGFAQTLLMEDTDSDESEDDEDDTRSVASYMAVGRGRPISNPLNMYLLKKFCFGRGRRIVS